VRSIAMYVSACLSVSPLAYLEDHTFNLHEKKLSDDDRPWRPGPDAVMCYNFRR